MLRVGDFKNIHQGVPAWIIGNGPSLKRMDLSLLKHEITFGMNCVFLGFDLLGFIPNYYTVEDNFVAEDNSRQISQLEGSIKFFPRDLSYCLKSDDQTCWVNFVRHYQPYPQFSSNCSEIIYWGSTVTYLAIQLAYFMGCDPLYLIGVDFDYIVPDYVDGQGEIISREEDVNHFHPAYFGPGKRWHHPRLDRVEPSYKEARRFLETKRRRIFNATVGGKLEVFDRVNYKNVLNN